MVSKPLFSPEEVAAFESKLKEIDNDKVSFASWDERGKARVAVRGAYFAQTITRIKDGRIDELLNYLLVIVGSRGAHAEFRMWDGFALSRDPRYAQLVTGYDTPINRRYVHMFLGATMRAYRSWALAAFVKFLRGNKVAGGKAESIEGFGDFNRSTGWTEEEIKTIAYVFFDHDSETSKLFMKYDTGLADRVYEEGGKSSWDDIPYQAYFAATTKTVNTSFIQELMDRLEARGLSPKPTTEKKAFKPREVHIFKPGEVIKSKYIADLPALAHIEISVLFRKNRNDTNGPLKVQIVLAQVPQPRQMLDIWCVVDGKAYLPKTRFCFDQNREALDGATYLGQWEAGVQAQAARHEYPYDYIGLNRS